MMTRKHQKTASKKSTRRREDERCRDKEKDVYVSKGEGHSGQQIMSDDDVREGAAISSNADDDEKLRCTEGINDRDECKLTPIVVRIKGS